MHLGPLQRCSEAETHLNKSETVSFSFESVKFIVAEFEGYCHMSVKILQDFDKSLIEAPFSIVFEKFWLFPTVKTLCHSQKF